MCYLCVSRVRVPRLAVTRPHRLRFALFFVSWSRCGPQRSASHASAASGAFWLFPYPAFVVPRSAVTRLHRIRLSSFFVLCNRGGPGRFASYAVGASASVRLLPRPRARYSAVSITWPHRSRLSSLLVFWNLRCLMRPASATFGHVWAFGGLVVVRGRRQAAEKILERTCVQF